MKNKKILLTLVIMCLTASLNSTSAMWNNMNNNSFNNFNNNINNNSFNNNINNNSFNNNINNNSFNNNMNNNSFNNNINNNSFNNFNNNMNNNSFNDNINYIKSLYKKLKEEDNRISKHYSNKFKIQYDFFLNKGYSIKQKIDFYDKKIIERLKNPSFLDAKSKPKIFKILKDYYFVLKNSICNDSYKNSIPDMKERYKYYLLQSKVFYVFIDIIRSNFEFSKKTNLLKRIEMTNKSKQYLNENNDYFIKLNSDIVSNHIKWGYRILPQNDQYKEQIFNIYDNILNMLDPYKIDWVCVNTLLIWI